MMNVTGEMLIGARSVRGGQGVVHAVNPATGEQMTPEFGGGSAKDVDDACTLAGRAFDAYRATPLEQRAHFLEVIAQGIMDLGDVLVERVMSESGLPRPRIEGERARTVGQLKLFAALVREGRWLNVTLDSAMPERKPVPRPDLARAEDSAWPGRCLRREQLSVGVFRRRWRYSIGAGGGLPRRRKVASLAPGNIGAGGPGDSKGGGRLWIARGGVLAAGGRWQCSG